MAGADAAHGVAVARCYDLSYDGNLRNCAFKSDIQRDTAYNLTASGSVPGSAVPR
jgi:hypothetical protein